MVDAKEIFNSDWPEALAAAAFFMIQGQDARILDKHEMVPEMQTVRDFGVRIKEFSNDPRMTEGLNMLITEVALAYVVERTTSMSNPGGPYTLIGHATSHDIELGFIALVLSSIDNFHAFTTFKEYNSLSRKITKAINTLSMDSTPADLEARRLIWIALEEECDDLREKAGL